ncbi:MAG: ATP-binding cassette domain-containing protein [Kineosporiaceae bacterium]|jgi:ABC-type multidrug transport system fused ATPase/permease subunit
MTDQTPQTPPRPPGPDGPAEPERPRGSSAYVSPADAASAALHVDDLEVDFVVRGIPRRVLRGVSFSVRPGESYGLVGESGCGKSTTAYAALGLLADNGRVAGGHALIAGKDVTAMSSSELPLPAEDRRALRGHRAAARGGGAGPQDGLPHPGGGAAPAADG